MDQMFTLGAKSLKRKVEQNLLQHIETRRFRFNGGRYC